MARSYFLLKSEPEVWSINQQINAGSKGANWDGIRNYQACNNLRKMKKAICAFFIIPTSEKKLLALLRL